MKIALALILLALTSVACMRVPAGLHVYESSSSCTSDGECPWHDGSERDFYVPRLHEIVVIPDQSIKVLAHEVCHAHQQQEVIDELGYDVSRDEHEWYLTSEYASYQEVVAANPRPTSWVLSSDSTLEDFATACAMYLVYGTIKDAPEREAFFASRNFR